MLTPPFAPSSGIPAHSVGGVACCLMYGDLHQSSDPSAYQSWLLCQCATRRGTGARGLRRSAFNQKHLYSVSFKFHGYLGSFIDYIYRPTPLDRGSGLWVQV